MSRAASPEECAAVERWAGVPGFIKLVVGPNLWADLGERYGAEIRDKIAVPLKVEED